MSTKFYAIYHKPTGKYMPARMFDNARAGWTWWEPTGANGLGGVDPEVPRLFTKKGSATQAMGYWLDGNYQLCSIQGYDDDVETFMKIYTPIIPRNRQDIEIHVITLIVKAVI